MGDDLIAYFFESVWLDGGLIDFKGKDVDE